MLIGNLVDLPIVLAVAKYMPCPNVYIRSMRTLYFIRMSEQLDHDEKSAIVRTAEKVKLDRVPPSSAGLLAVEHCADRKFQPGDAGAAASLCCPLAHSVTQ